MLKIHKSNLPDELYARLHSEGYRSLHTAILGLLATGMSKRAIARRYGLSRATVDKYTRAIDWQKVHDGPRWCKCGNPKILAKGLCSSCFNYQNKTGKVRAKRLYTDEPVCGNCKRPLTKGRGRRVEACRGCYDYRRRHGVERPLAECGMGPYGWCDCAGPATHAYLGYKLCDKCMAEERSEY